MGATGDRLYGFVDKALSFIENIPGVRRENIIMSVGARGSLEPYIPDSIEFYPHQIEGIRRMARMKSVLLADDMGLGKSLQSLTVFAIDVYMKFANSAIIVCPATLKGNWMQEISDFTTFKAVELGKGMRKDGKGSKNLSAAERSKQIEEFRNIEEPKILIVNYEQVVSHVKELNSLAFDLSIFDESHYLKNHKSKRTKASMSLYTPRSILISGSPMLNKPDDLWTTFYRINPDEYPSYWAFRQRYCVFGGYENREIVGIQNEKELTSRLQSVMIRRLKTEVLTLPKPYFLRRLVDLSPLQQKMYNEIVTEMRMTLPDDEDNPVDIENALTKFLRLKQICGTTATVIDKDESSKLDLAVEDAKEFASGGNKVVVFTQFRGVLESYKNRINAEIPGVPVFTLHGDVKIGDRQDMVRNWTNTKGPAFIICMLQVAGVGLNMTAAKHMQFLDKLFSPKMNQQAVDRIHRIGQSETQAVQIFEYIARDTIEKRVEDILRSKSKIFDEIIEVDDWKKKLVKEVLGGR